MAICQYIAILWVQYIDMAKYNIVTALVCMYWDIGYCQGMLQVLAWRTTLRVIPKPQFLILELIVFPLKFSAKCT